jgi:hypothetical protein
VRWPTRSMLPSLLLIVAGFAAVFNRVKLAYEKDKGEVAQRPQGGDDNVRWLSRLFWPFLLLIFAGFAAVSKRVKLAYE